MEAIILLIMEERAVLRHGKQRIFSADELIYRQEFSVKMADYLAHMLNKIIYDLGLRESDFEANFQIKARKNQAFLRSFPFLS